MTTRAIAAAISQLHSKFLGLTDKHERASPIKFALVSPWLVLFAQIGSFQIKDGALARLSAGDAGFEGVFQNHRITVARPQKLPRAAVLANAHEAVEQHELRPCRSQIQILYDQRFHGVFATTFDSFGFHGPAFLSAWASKHNSM
jgi:hypothetical protein